LSHATGNPQDGTQPYAIQRFQFERDLAAAVDPTAPWPQRLAAAIGATLRWAAADPASAHRLALPAAGRRSDDLGAFTAMVDDLAAELRRGAPAVARPERTARNVVLRVARQILLQLEAGPEEPVTSIGPDLIVFALTPYVGLATARCLADQSQEGDEGGAEAFA
jgi:hypothetical protein